MALLLALALPIDRLALELLCCRAGALPLLWVNTWLGEAIALPASALEAVFCAVFWAEFCASRASLKGSLMGAAASVEASWAPHETSKRVANRTMQKLRDLLFTARSPKKEVDEP